MPLKVNGPKQVKVLALCVKLDEKRRAIVQVAAPRIERVGFSALLKVPPGKWDFVLCIFIDGLKKSSEIGNFNIIDFVLKNFQSYWNNWEPFLYKSDELYWLQYIPG